jgi:hypothetical protein
MGWDPLEAALRRAMQARGAFTDPFTLMEIATLLRRIAREGPESVADRRGSLEFESAVDYLAKVFERASVEKPLETARAVIEAALRECWETGCSRG